MPTSTHTLSWFVLILTSSVIVSNTLPHAAIAQNIEPDEIIRVKLDLNGPNNEWVRIERRGNLVKLVHTKRSYRRKGAGGVANFLIDTVGPSNIAFSDWDDHQTTRTLFEPDDCSNSTARSPSVPSLPSPAGTSEQLRLPLNSSACAVTGEDTLVLPAGTDIRQGQFTVEYIERKLLRAITFRVPPEDK